MRYFYYEGSQDGRRLEEADLWWPRGLVPLTELKLVPRYIRHTHMYNSTSLVYSLSMLYTKQMFLYHLAYKLIIMAVEPYIGFVFLNTEVHRASMQWCQVFFLLTLYNSFEDHLLIWSLILGLIDQYDYKEMINEHVL